MYVMNGVVGWLGEGARNVTPSPRSSPLCSVDKVYTSPHPLSTPFPASPVPSRIFNVN